MRNLRRAIRYPLLVVEGMSVRSRRNWRGTLITGTIVPICTLAALGVGLGSLVPEGAFADTSYLRYLAPALLASTCVQYAISEAAEPVMAGFKWQRTYEAAVATPVTAGQLMTGQLCWIGIRTSLIAVLFLLAMLLFGVVADPSALLAVAAAIFGAVSTAAPVMAFAAVARDGSAFSLLNRLVVIPMVMLSGVFFPIELLPGLLAEIAWISPLAHTVALCRGTVIGELSLGAVAVHVLALTCWLGLGSALAVRQFRRRLIS